MPLKSQIPNLGFLNLRSLQIWSLVILCYFVISVWDLNAQAQEKFSMPIVVNGDTVEYSTEDKVVTATGHVEVIYKGTKLTCQKLTVNTQTKEGIAEGNVKIEDEKGIIEGSKVVYNFQAKTGLISDGTFRSHPYFGKAEKIEKISDAEFIALNTDISTCNFDRPHYYLISKKIDYFPHNRIDVRGAGLYAGRIPLFYLPRFMQNLADPLMHVQLMPGTRSEWGAYLLSAWRYNLNKNLAGRIYLDYRKKLGFASGFGLNYLTGYFGKGDLKFYYSDERPEEVPAGELREFERYFTRLRHKWEIDSKSDLAVEYYKIEDKKRKRFDAEADFLKDYFYREYEKNSQPLSYLLLHHNFDYSSINLLMQKRTNHWFDQLEKLPEARFSLFSLKLGQTPFYLESNTSAANFSKKQESEPLTASEVNLTRIDTLNRLALPFKLAFLELTPFAASRQTYYDKAEDGSSVVMRTIFYSGLNLNTKFYRVFDLKSNFLGMDINGVRHIITPTVQYGYNHEPTVLGDELRQVDAVDTILRSNTIAFGLSNKLQTKRENKTVAFADFRVTGLYDFYNVDSATNTKKGGSFTDFLFDLELLPYSWLRMDADADYETQGDHFSTANYDLYFKLGEERFIGVGQRYQRKGANEITSSINWRLTPKWRFNIFGRYNLGGDPELRRGLREQEYSLSRDLHCWTMDIACNIKKGEDSSVWLIFKLKAFPEVELGFNQSYHAPQSGAQD